MGAYPVPFIVAGSQDFPLTSTLSLKGEGELKDPPSAPRSAGAVIPAKAGIQVLVGWGYVTSAMVPQWFMDSRFRGNDDAGIRRFLILP